ncbi:hypothetical protein [Ensifer sp. Root127]|uniref:hypothetical protein n=1 Tax=Ensifer sp. Root127 TaxID=1736440 RepID=UPI00070D5ABC|nr:hypothetical protein [Ensifer sp. Root127]KQW82049.1 hypothetical protein ASD03_23310 [Ensifer sp. Root127]
MKTQNSLCAAIFGFSSLTASILDAAAADFEMTLFGRHVTVLGSYPEQRLEIDGRQMLKEAIIDLEDMYLVSGVPALIGTASPGGNACEGAPFIISFPENGNPRLDGPLETCFVVTVDTKPDQLAFSTAALPNHPSERWIWTPGEGLKKVQGQPFTTDPSKGWTELREKTVSHPGDLLKFGEIAEQIDTLLGTDASFFSDIIKGVGSGQFDGDYFVGTACTRHMCLDQEAIVVLSIADRQVFLAWKPSGKKIIVRPIVKEWPEKAKSALRMWAAKWK